MPYVSKRVPRVKQQEALTKIAGRTAFALLMQMRCGKTKVAIDDFGRLVDEGSAQDLVVIAPAGVYRTWEKAIEEDYPDPLPLIHTWRSGSYGSQKARNLLRAFLDDRSGPRVLLINAEALSSVKAARECILEFMAQRDCVAVIDESTLAKNPSAERTKFLVRYVAPLAKYRRILSGLPTPRSPLDLYSQFEFLDPKILGFKSYYAFRSRFAVTQRMSFGGRSVDVVVNYRDTDKLQALIQPHSFRVRLEDCYDLPPKIYTRREVPLTKDQERMYKEMVEFATAKISGEDFVTATAVITQILRLHQLLCGHTRDDAGQWHPIPERRTETLLDLLEEYDGKAIIWASYDADIQKISTALQKEYGEDSVARFWGGNRETREEEERKFLSSPSCRFIVATPAAGGRGRTWVNADLVVYYSSTNDLEHRSQSEERAQGVGKSNSVMYVDMIAPNTVEDKILHALRNKINMASVITGDNWKTWVV